MENQSLNGITQTAWLNFNLLTAASTGKDVDELELSYIARENIKWTTTLENFVSFLHCLWTLGLFPFLYHYKESTSIHYVQVPNDPTIPHLAITPKN